jgi:hypothetical protein
VQIRRVTPDERASLAWVLKYLRSEKNVDAVVLWCALAQVCCIWDLESFLTLLRDGIIGYCPKTSVLKPILGKQNARI